MSHAYQPLSPIDADADPDHIDRSSAQSHSSASPPSSSAPTPTSSQTPPQQQQQTTASASVLAAPSGNEQTTTCPTCRMMLRYVPSTGCDLIRCGQCLQTFNPRGLLEVRQIRCPCGLILQYPGYSPYVRCPRCYLILTHPGQQPHHHQPSPPQRWSSTPMSANPGYPGASAAFVPPSVSPPGAAAALPPPPSSSSSSSVSSVEPSPTSASAPPVPVPAAGSLRDRSALESKEIELIERGSGSSK